ncbi:TIGR03759 family integrating conjugative element protein [Halorhodospira abdelmalekii]|uniref:TIGR03759 family integrating conjugative element protein n=1 Tax=Halorhodospira abdelmalekii TaxID=421629 RepID=UPI0019066647|nr:TIGR03759 family integrating conjugative element protein [Halorhodospira abdelmalekii]MBK1734906.1 TIGR03759 family integrating conjugative element protein [Halorhodospira abdelmalekii]
MNARAWIRCAALGAGLLGMLPAAASDRAPSELQEHEERSSSLGEPLDRSQWGELSEQEWARYESLMEGPRGLWSPDLDPVWVLGIHARSAKERQRMAEIAVERERERVRQELAFQYAYDDAWDRLYPDETPFANEAGERAAQGASQHDNAEQAAEQQEASIEDIRPGDRVALVTRKEDCAACDTALERLIGALDQGTGWEADVFVVDAESDHEVRKWATEQQVPPQWVETQRLTLNRDQGVLAELEVPALYRRDGARWEPLSLR